MSLEHKFEVRTISGAIYFKTKSSKHDLPTACYYRCLWTVDYHEAYPTFPPRTSILTSTKAALYLHRRLDLQTSIHKEKYKCSGLTIKGSPLRTCVLLD